MNARTHPLMLSSLLEGFVADVPPIPMGELRLDSREISPGDVFVALRGERFNGADYLSMAAKAGAVAALTEELPAESIDDLPIFVIPALRVRLGEIASRFYGHPSRALQLTAVTGTNGKTTVSQLLGQLVRSAGYDCGVLGTIGAGVDGRARAAVHTTPDPISLQRTLATWAGKAIPFASMEASSHALEQGRLSGVDVDTAVFTNLSRDHLDYHKTMQAYGNAKAKLFGMPSLRAVILNADDPFSKVLETGLGESVKLLRYGQHAPELEVSFSKLVADASGLRFNLHSPWGSAKVRSGLLGAFNAYNLVAAITAALQAGLPLNDLVAAIPSLQPVPGRMEALRADNAPLVVVDYAHTPDALAKVTQTLRAQCAGRLIVVFGCGGDRDPGKRPLMAEAVSNAADSAVVTSDNPRTEDPYAIMQDIATAMRCEHTLCEDRGEAIRRAVLSASPGDCVLIAGKGHEDYQLVNDVRKPFSDYEHASTALEARGA